MDMIMHIEDSLPRTSRTLMLKEQLAGKFFMIHLFGPPGGVIDLQIGLNKHDHHTVGSVFVPPLTPNVHDGHELLSRFCPPHVGHVQSTGVSYLYFRHS